MDNVLQSVFCNKLKLDNKMDKLQIEQSTKEYKKCLKSLICQQNFQLMQILKRLFN